MFPHSLARLHCTILTTTTTTTTISHTHKMLPKILPAFAEMWRNNPWKYGECVWDSVCARIKYAAIQVNGKPHGKWGKMVKMVWPIRTKPKPVGRQKKEIALCAKSYCSTWYAGADYNERFIILIWIFQNSKWNQAAGLFSHLHILCVYLQSTYMYVYGIQNVVIIVECTQSFKRSSSSLGIGIFCDFPNGFLEGIMSCIDWMESKIPNYYQNAKNIQINVIFTKRIKLNRNNYRYWSLRFWFTLPISFYSIKYYMNYIHIYIHHPHVVTSSNALKKWSSKWNASIGMIEKHFEQMKLSFKQHVIHWILQRIGIVNFW